LEGLECTCGGHGCLETLAGGWGIAMRAKKELRKNSPEARFLKKNFLGDSEKITAKDVIQSFLKGDPFSKKIIDEAVLALIAGGTMIVNALNPETLIISGGIPDGFPSLISQIEQGIYKRAIKDAVKSLKVFPGYFKNNAGMIGAAL